MGKPALTFEEVHNKIEYLRHELEKDIDNPILTTTMESYLHDFSFENKTLSIAFPVLKHELNPNGTMIGGIMQTALDMTYGLLIYFLDGEVMPPTISMTTNFLKPIFLGDTLIVTTKIDSWGKKVIHLTGTCTSKKSGDTIVTSTSVFLGTSLCEKKL